ncbi:uncharacterized protein G2W53_043322 [Senna tora]|uniref:Uncharacterized protein n=1 Tax=Senna tora TaxID=362788 RepID=A0A834SIG2_9FABA|nr:uncharacterized protein G2W53_043322 [Senna tora]
MRDLKADYRKIRGNVGARTLESFFLLSRKIQDRIRVCHMTLSLEYTKPPQAGRRPTRR